MNHYFSVTIPKVFERLSEDDFICVSSEDEHLLTTLDTSNPVAVFDWKLKRRSREKIEDEEDIKPTIPIMDQDIQNRINSYKKQDQKKERQEYELTIEDVRTILATKTCCRCDKEVSWWDWTLDRIDNEIGHSPDNVKLRGRHCNVVKKDYEQQMFFWDTETPNQPLITAMYSVGITPDKGYFKDTHEFYQSLYEDTIVYFDTEPAKVMEKFENWIIKKSEEIRIKVERLLGIWTKKVIKSKSDITKEELEKKQ